MDFLHQAFELLDASVLLALMKHMKGDASHGTNSESKTPSPSLGGGSKEDWPHLFSSIVSSLTTFLTSVSLKDHGEILDILIEAFSALAQYPPAGGPSLKSNDHTPQGWCVSMVGCVFLSTVFFPVLGKPCLLDSLPFLCNGHNQCAKWPCSIPMHNRVRNEHLKKRYCFVNTCQKL